MADKYWWQEDEKQTTTQSSTQSSNKTSKKYWWQDDSKDSKNQGYWWDDGTLSKKAGQNIANRVNTLLKNYSKYITDHKLRTSGRKYNFEDSYVSDSANRLSIANKQKSDFDAEVDSILTSIEQNKGFLNEEWVKQVKTTLANAQKGQSSILEFYTKDNEYWSRFGADEELVGKYGSAEDVYKYYQRSDGYNKKYAGMSHDDIKTALDNLEDGEEKDWLDTYQWSRMFSESDFDQYSNAGAAIKNPTLSEAESDGRFLFWSWDGADVGNIVTYSRENADALAMAKANNENTQGNYVYRSMKDDEVKLYNYILAKYGKEKGDEFLSYIMDDLLAREGGALANRLQGIDIPVVEELAIGLFGLGAGVDQWASGARQFLTNEKQPYSVEQYANNELLNSMDGFGKNVYQATNVIGNMLPSIALSKGLGALGAGVKAAKIAGAATMSIGAAGNAYSDGLEYGMEQWQARIYGTLVGAAEGALEYVMGGIPALRGAEDFVSAKIKLIDNGLLRIGAKLGWDVVQEISEEELQNFLEPAFRAIFTGEYDAPTVDELIETAIVTAISTPVMGGAGTVIDDIRGSKNAITNYGDKTDALIQEGLESDTNSESYKLATKYQKQIQGKNGKQGKALSGNQIRNLLAANQEQVTPKDMKKIQTAAEKRLTDLGQTDDVSKLAELATKWATGQKLSKDEKNFLASSKYGSRVANELLPANIASGEYSTAWAEEIGTKEVNAGAYNAKAIRTLLDAMANAEDSASYKSLEERVGTEAKFNVSESGKATIHGTDEAISLDKVEVTEFVKDKETGKVTDMVLKVDGKEVKASEIDYADDSQSHLFSAVSQIENISPADAQAIIRDYDPASGLSVGEYLNGIDEGFTYGYHNYSEADLKAGNFAPKLGDVQAKSAYVLGQNASKNRDTNKTEAIVRMRTAVEAEAEKAKAEGKEAPKSKELTITVTNEKGETVTIDEADTTEGKQSGGIKVAQILHKLGLGTNFRFFTSYLSETMKVKDKKTGKLVPARVFLDENGVEQLAPAGVYRMSDGTICIDMNAYNGRQLTLNALAHELTHFIQQWSTKKYKVLVDFLMQTYEDTGITMHQRVLREQARLKDVISCDKRW